MIPTPTDQVIRAMIYAQWKVRCGGMEHSLCNPSLKVNALVSERPAQCFSAGIREVCSLNKKGRIISIASGAAAGPNPYAPSYLPYGAGKAGLIGFTKLLARDLGCYGDQDERQRRQSN